MLSLLLTTSSKLLTSPPALKTSYSRGTWISHRTLCEMSLWLMTHLANLSHSPRFLGISFNPLIRLYSSPAVNRQSPLRLLILALLKIRDKFWRYQLMFIHWDRQADLESTRRGISLWANYQSSRRSLVIEKIQLDYIGHWIYRIGGTPIMLADPLRVRQDSWLDEHAYRGYRSIDHMQWGWGIQRLAAMSSLYHLGEWQFPVHQPNIRTKGDESIHLGSSSACTWWIGASAFDSY